VTGLTAPRVRPIIRVTAQGERHVAERDDRFISRLSWIAFFLAFVVAVLSIIMNWPTPAPAGEIAAMTGSL
jgi:hypothetical protein